MTGSAFLISVQVPAEALEVIKGTPKTWIRTADSGNQITRYLCADCGSVLFGQNKARPKIRVITGGTLDDPSWVPIQANIWTQSALPWVHLSEEVENFPKGADWSKYYAGDPSRLQR